MHKSQANKPGSKATTQQQGTLGRGVLLPDRRPEALSRARLQTSSVASTVGRTVEPPTLVDNRQTTIVQRSLRGSVTKKTAPGNPVPRKEPTLIEPVSEDMPEQIMADSSSHERKEHEKSMPDGRIVQFIHELHAYIESKGPFTEADRPEIEKFINAEIAGNYLIAEGQWEVITGSILGGLVFYDEEESDASIGHPSQRALLAQRGLEPQATRGDGNCSIHALLAEDNGGTLIHGNAQQTRGELADGYNSGTLQEGAMHKMDEARENSIRHFSGQLLTDYTEGKQSFPEEEEKDKPKKKEGEDEWATYGQLKNNLLKAIHAVNVGQYEASVKRAVQDDTFNGVIEGVAGAQVIEILKEHRILSADNTVANRAVNMGNIEAALPEVMKYKADSVFSLLKPYIKGKTDSNPFVLRALQNEAVKTAYIALLKNQHHWLNAEQLQALAIQHEKSIQLFENDLMGGVQETPVFNAEADRPLVQIYSGGSHFERLRPLQPGAIQANPELNKDDGGTPGSGDADDFQHGMYDRAHERYHTPFRGQTKRTTEKYRARHGHGLGHGIRVAASVLKLVNTISQTHTIKFNTDEQHLKALAMAALWHDAANNAEDDKIKEYKHGELFDTELKKQTGKSLDVKKGPVYQWAAECLKLKGKVSFTKKRWEDLNEYEQGAAIISGADSYEYIRSYPKMKEKYDLKRNILIKTGAMNGDEDTAHLESVISLIQKTGGNTKGGGAGGTNPEALATAFEYHGIRALMQPGSTTANAFEEFTAGSGQGPANILALLHGFSGSPQAKKQLLPASKLSGKISPVLKSLLGTGKAFGRTSSVSRPLLGTGKPPGRISPVSKPSLSSGKPTEKKAVAKSAVTGTAKVDVKIVRKLGSPSPSTALKPEINFSPRNESGRPVRATKNADGSYKQGVAPAFRPGTGRTPNNVDVGNTLALVHGIGTQFIPGAFKKGYLSSAYSREGPYGNYSRNADKIGGGGLAVYTRAVGKKHLTWPAFGQGVGSGEKKAQIVLHPQILQSGLTWRHSSADLMGMAPGALKTMVNKPGIDSFDLWQQQSESARNSAFNETVNDGAKGGIANNEQMFWHQIPLAGNVIAIICQTEEDKKELIVSMGETGNLVEGCILQEDGTQVPVIVAGEKEALAHALTKDE
jgi:hypothetical protein